MTTNFSASTLLADLDYIAPGQQCILPMQRARGDGDGDAAIAGVVAGEVKIHARRAGGGSIGSGATIVDDADADVAAAGGARRVQITLQDCLACSGCVTSAETILITSPSRGEVERLSQLALDARANGIARGSRSGEFLVTLAEQSVSAAAVEWGCDFDAAARRIARFCRAAA